MQLKNNQTRNAQFYFWKEGKNKKETLEYVHIPGGATVEIDDQVFKALTASRTEVRVMKEVETKLDEASSGADVKTGKDTLIVKGLVNYKALTARGVPIKDMTEDAKLALYDQLA